MRRAVLERFGRVDAGQTRAIDALVRALTSDPADGRGVYLHGAAGRGKTALAGCALQTLGREKRAKSWHFHALMAHAHAGTSREGYSSDGFAAFGARLAKESDGVILVDEVEISDVADAMVFKRVMEGYFASGGRMIGTSNFAPEQLYAGGINRANFASFVETLRERCEVVDLDAECEAVDYRRLNGVTAPEVADTVVVGNDNDARARLERTWARFEASTSGDSVSDELDIRVAAGRTIRAKRRIGDRAAWFTFEDICGRQSRAAPSDYLALAEKFEMICVQNVPRLPMSSQENAARRFINLIDVLYERRVVFIANLATVPDELFNEYETSSFRVPDLSTRERTRVESNFAAELSVSSKGGSSGRSTTVLANNTEWSATGRIGASLADASASNFTAAAAPRAKSRLVHMSKADYFRDTLPILATANVSRH